MGDEQRIPAPNYASEQLGEGAEGDGPRVPSFQAQEPLRDAYRDDPSIREVSTFTRLRFVFGGPAANFFVAGFFIFPMIVMGLIATKIDYGSWFRSNEWGVSAQAEIVDLWETNMTVNDRSVIGHEFEFRDRHGSKQSGVSYVTGQMVSIGSPFEVRYDPESPSDAVLVGMRKKPAGTTLALVYLLPALVLLSLLVGARKRSRTLQVLLEGKRFDLTLKSFNASSVVYQYYDQGGVLTEFRHGLKTPDDPSAHFTLVMPRDGGKGLIIEKLDSQVRFTKQGEVEINTPFWRLFWIPLIFVGLFGFLVMMQLDLVQA
ncbi:MAG: hypothetical protein KDB07_06085 [Planctomycetes bacterium]|nr:hypothetical protein [Planctomycetota bacterium]